MRGRILWASIIIYLGYKVFHSIFSKTNKSGIYNPIENKNTRLLTYFYLLTVT